MNVRAKASRSRNLYITTFDSSATNQCNSLARQEQNFTIMAYSTLTAPVKVIFDHIESSPAKFSSGTTGKPELPQIQL